MRSTGGEGAAMGNRLVEQKPKAVEVVVLSQLVQCQNVFRLHRTTAPKLFIKGVCTPYGKLSVGRNQRLFDL